MRYLVAILFIYNTLLFAANTTKNEKDLRLERQIKREIEKEKKYAKEQTFYNQDSYDFKRSEVNEESLSTLPEIEVDDLDMDSVYD